MSKKDKLKKQKEKQIQMKKLADLEELEEREAALHKESKGAKKLRRRAKHGYVNIWQMFLKMLLSAAFLYSGFFHGGVLAVAVLGDNIYISDEKLMPHWVGYCVIAGAAAIFLGVVFAFIKKYIVSFALVAAGNGVFMKGVMRVMKTLKSMMSTQYVPADQENMYREYMFRYYPILLTLLFSFILLAIYIAGVIRRRRRHRLDRDSAPVESIVGE